MTTDIRPLEVLLILREIDGKYAMGTIALLRDRQRASAAAQRLCSC